MSKKPLRRIPHGFSLTEMMVTVAILGILVALGVPAYQRQIYRARQNEAQVELSQVYTAERSYYTDIGTFTGCLGAIGVLATGGLQYYTYGFGSNESSPDCGPNGGQACTSYKFDRDGIATATCPNTQQNSTYFRGNAASTTGDPNLFGDDYLPAWNSEPTRFTFTATAVGFISTKGVTDLWQIDNNRRLSNVSPGI